MELILASQSPRRRELMTNAGYAFRILVSRADEDLPAGTPPAEGVRILAERKAKAVETALPPDILEAAPVFVIGADTLVELNGVPLGKPKDEAEATAMLSSLSGARHHVVTGVAVAVGGRIFSGVETTAVTFRPLSKEEIADYVATGEPMDKAGAYGIQAGAVRFVQKVDGEIDNVIGLPRKLLAKLLRDAGYEPGKETP